MAKGYYVIPSMNEDMTEFKNKKQAYKFATDLYNNGDYDVEIMRYDDDNKDGYCSKVIMVRDLLREVSV